MVMALNKTNLALTVSIIYDELCYDCVDCHKSYGLKGCQDCQIAIPALS